MMMGIVEKGYFIDRPNRFVVHVSLNGQRVTCHMPNPGRMWELLFPGVIMYVRKVAVKGRKTPYDVVGIDRDGVPILLDTQYNNTTAAMLVQQQRIPGWEGYTLLRREITVGDSRFDLLLDRGGEKFYVEVKSCTLFSHDGAMFPDAVTERGRKHIMELAAMHDKGIHTGVLFLVHWERAKWFLPDYHTDPAFAEAFREAAPRLDWKALSLCWDSSFCNVRPRELLAYPEEILLRENHDRGDYMVVLHIQDDKDISIGAKGSIHFPKGYYVYVGSAKQNLAARLARHQRKRKKMHWHIDYLRQEADVTAIIPIRTADDLEHELAGSVSSIAPWSIAGFGCTDCQCSSHLFGFSDNPIHRRDFMEVVENFRMNRLSCL
jgi:sugar fermentation stimulation protein A